MGVARYRDEEDAKRFGEEWIRGGGGGGGGEEEVGRVIAEMKIRRDNFQLFSFYLCFRNCFPRVERTVGKLGNLSSSIVLYKFTGLSPRERARSNSSSSEYIS